MASTYPRESVEYVGFGTVTVNGGATTAFEYAITEHDRRPPVASSDAWLTPATVGDGRKVFLLDGSRVPGRYVVWVKVDADPEHVIMQAGEFTIT